MALPQTVPVLEWRWDDLLFLLLAGVLLGAALMVVLGRNIIRSGLWMMLSFGGLAGIYWLLGAELVAIAQVLVYIGAISVLILFAIMLTQSKGGPGRLVFHRQWWAAGIAAVVLAGLFLLAIMLTAWPLAGTEVIAAGAREIAALMFDEYVLAFEVISLLLLAAVVGGIFLARRERAPGAADEPEPTVAPSTLPLGARSASSGLPDKP